MKYLLLIFMFFPLKSALAFEHADGKIKVPIAKVNDVYVYSEAEKQERQAKYTAIGGTSTPVTKDQSGFLAEIAIATNVVNFRGDIDFKESQTKDGLMLKMKPIYDELKFYETEFPNSSVTKALKQRYYYLKEIYDTLP